MSPNSLDKSSLSIVLVKNILESLLDLLLGWGGIGVLLNINFKFNMVEFILLGRHLLGEGEKCSKDDGSEGGVNDNFFLGKDFFVHDLNSVDGLTVDGDSGNVFLHDLVSS